MAWLNVPVETIDDYRSYQEKQYYLLEGVGSYRKRTVTVIVYLYVGCDYTGAKAKADSFLGNSAYTDVDVIPVGGGQYHCRATHTSEGAWSAWQND